MFYDFKCKACGDVYEISLGMNEVPAYTAGEKVMFCPECGTPMIRVFSAPSVVIKGYSAARIERVASEKKFYRQAYKNMVTSGVPYNPTNFMSDAKKWHDR